MIIILGSWKTIYGSISLCVKQKPNINPAPNNSGYGLSRIFSEENSSTTSGPFWEISCLFHALKQYLWDAVQLKEGINILKKILS